MCKHAAFLVPGRQNAVSSFSLVTTFNYSCSDSTWKIAWWLAFPIALEGERSFSSNTVTFILSLAALSYVAKASWTHNLLILKHCYVIPPAPGLSVILSCKCWTSFCTAQFSICFCFSANMVSSLSCWNITVFSCIDVAPFKSWFDFPVLPCFFFFLIVAQKQEPSFSWQYIQILSLSSSRKVPYLSFVMLGFTFLFCKCFYCFFIFLF